MAHCKNVGGGPDNDERHPPRSSEQEKVKGPKKMFTKKKLKRGEIEVERAAAVAAAIERAERGGRGSGVRIGDKLSPAQRAIVEEFEASHGSPRGTIMLGGQRVSLEDAPEGPRVEEIEPQEETEQH
jgi:hypothetical protein